MLSFSLKKIAFITIFSIFLFACREANFKEYSIEKIVFSSDFYSDSVHEVSIKNKEEVDYYVSQVSNLKNGSDVYFKPFEGALDIHFYVKWKNGENKIIPSLHTSIIIKKDNVYIFTNYNGEFKNDSLANEIIKRYKKGINNKDFE